MATGSRKLTLVNILGTLGYISIVFQWLWTIVIVANPILSSDFSFFVPTAPVPTEAAPISTPPSPIVVVAVILLTIVVFVATLYILWRLPKSLGMKASKATKKTADAIAPLIPHHHPTTKKRRRALSHRIVVCIKWGIILLPLLVILPSQDIGPMTKDIIIWVGIFCAACSSTYIGAQLILARVWQLPHEQVW